MLRRLTALCDWLSDAAGAVGAAATLLLTAMVAGGVFARRVLNSPFLFVEEVSGYMVLAIVFLGLAYTMKGNGHIRVELIFDRTHGALRRALELTALVLATIWALLVLGGSWYQVREYYVQNVHSFAYLQTPLWIPGIMMVVGAALLVVECLALLVRHWRR